MAAVFGYINLKLFKLPTTIGIMLIGLILSTLLLVFRDTVPLIPDLADRFVESIDLNEALMEGMLSFLLFARCSARESRKSCGSEKADRHAREFRSAPLHIFDWWSHLLSLSRLCFEMPFLWCLVFGALISPTDPVAVWGS